MTVTGHSDSVMSVEWNDGTKLATGSYDKTKAPMMTTL
jgi:hypothetical protein